MTVGRTHQLHTTTPGRRWHQDGIKVIRSRGRRGGKRTRLTNRWHRGARDSSAGHCLAHECYIQKAAPSSQNSSGCNKTLNHRQAQCVIKTLSILAKRSLIRRAKLHKSSTLNCSARGEQNPRYHHMCLPCESLPKWRLGKTCITAVFPEVLLIKG